VEVGIFLEKLLSKLLRPFLKGVSSRARISPATFHEIATKLALEFPTKISFVRGDLWEELSSGSDFHQHKVIILGSSDRDWRKGELPDWPGTTFFVQNLIDGESEQVKLLPIGVEDYSWARNGMPWNFGERLRFRNKSTECLVGPFGATHLSRLQLQEVATGLQSVYVLRERLPSWQYSKIASSFGYIACPRGNGFDTHRFWESLYRGSVPVVVKSRWAQDVASYAVPLVILNEWRELENSRKQVETSPLSPYLEPSWWEKRFRDLLTEI
jgi:hypothetical protein